jgi:hypothetical protein
VNPVLAEGELGYETDTGLFKIGRGTTGWSSGPYGGLAGPTGPTGALDTTVSNLTVNGTLKIQQVEEALVLKTAATGSVTHDWSTGATFHHSSIAGDFTVALTNMPTDANKVYTVRLILMQGSTPYYGNALSVNGSGVSIAWQNNATPSPAGNKREIETLTLFYTGSTWSAMGAYTSFG